ncbi:hypothetical protein [Candidatus Spongiihabitans sp.]|uniref:hypothetical protein n=1 Tax=Candidatus Spongiihabitans sp. TaxID=3101308 RepID=UPI003C7CDCD6
MSHLWGRYDNFQIFLHVAVVAVDFDQPATPPAKLPVTKFKALLDTGAQRTAISNAVATVK